MDRIDHNLDQGSDSWLQFRLEHFGASEAAAAMGISPYMTRTELLTLKKSGIAKDINAITQTIFDKGHQVEALARPIIETRIGEDLYPITVSRGKLSASCDGLTMDDSTGFECKQFNRALFDSVKAGVLPDPHQPQVQQCLYVTGAKQWIFTVSDGTEDNTVSMTVYPDPDYIQTIIQAWAQFERDLADFVPVTHAAKAVAEPVKALPALAIHIKGEVSLSNLPRFKEAAEAFVATIKTDLTTDQDFADAEANVKFLDEAEKSLELAKKAALSQTVDIDELMRTIDQIKDSMRVKRLALDKLVKSKKEEIKTDIVIAAQSTLAACIAVLNAEIKPAVISIRGDFAGAIKGKRSIVSLHDAVNTEISRCEIEANSIAASVRKNLTFLNSHALAHKALFADLSTLALQTNDTFSAIIENRVAAEIARIAKISADAKARTEAQAKVEAEAQAAVAAQTAPAEPTIVMTPKTVAVPIAPAVTDKYADKKAPSLRELASAIAFEYAIDAKTATAWIIAAVNQYLLQSEAA